MQRPPRFFSRAIFQKEAQPLAILGGRGERKKRERKKIDRGSFSREDELNGLFHFVRFLWWKFLNSWYFLESLVPIFLEKKIACNYGSEEWRIFPHFCDNSFFQSTRFIVNLYGFNNFFLLNELRFSYKSSKFKIDRSFFQKNFNNITIISYR